MGDVRFAASYRAIRDAADRPRALARLTDEETVEALAAASRANDPLLANVLATEAANRMKRLRSTLASLGEGVVTLGPDGVVRWANPSAERLLSCHRDEMVGRRLDELARCRGQTLQRAIERHEEFIDEEDVLELPGGVVRHVRTTASIIHEDDGTLAGVVITLVDATERRLRDRRLMESERRFRSLFEHAFDAVSALHLDGTILESNAAAERLLGIPRAELVGMRYADVLHSEDVGRARTLFDTARGGEVARGTIRIRRRDGEVMSVDTVAVPIVVDDVVVGIYGAARPSPTG